MCASPFVVLSCPVLTQASKQSGNPGTQDAHALAAIRVIPPHTLLLWHSQLRPETLPSPPRHTFTSTSTLVPVLESTRRQQTTAPRPAPHDHEPWSRAPVTSCMSCPAGPRPSPAIGVRVTAEARPGPASGRRPALGLVHTYLGRAWDGSAFSFGWVGEKWKRKERC
ncbi:uncharacterized protein K452DRAFT_62723 [Aplosporella prunicola CBS 121167]|uniref:Uncharacterized protein n=1 Tax=Aplosporella prunicola CBS 121167 TaxID=1176127 RepID=A0A6A6B8B7_9PEZI|nr:uncharacterized protein K452DRAFT_62723 [Aplosporella prunicola CBS 121167]KAF2139603.1 hypothetical protein K452DRAFT_62723 [Aplosporella prunicola CBS 121167]